MPRPRSTPDVYLLSKVGSLYYAEHRTQQEIADRLGISRPAVSRLLQEAHDRGIVQITVAAPGGLHLELERRLESRFGLAAAQVVDVDRDAGRRPDKLRREIGAAAAAYLARTVQPGETIGLAWGTTLDAMVQAMSPLTRSGVSVVQTLGGIGPPDANAYAAEVVRRLAQLLGATPVLLPAPGVVATRAVRNALRRDHHVRTALARLDRLDAIYVGIGSLRSNPVLRDGRSLPAGIYRELRAAGAVGDIALRFFDHAGAPVRSSLDDRILGITAEQLRATKRVVAMAGGPDKVDAIYAALMAGLVDVLVTDSITAATIAGRAPAPARR
jgi:DNA-binding transcriptional regulator LsrR (DeoR family)